MRKHLTIAVVLTLVLASVGGVQAADVGGELIGELRVLTKEDKPLEDAVASLAVKTDIEGELGEGGEWKLGLDIRLDKALSLFRDEIWDADHTDDAEDHIALELDEAYLNLYSISGEPLDLRLGKQYVDVGVGDGITVFSLTRPVAANFIDQLQNTRAVTGVRADYYADDVSITAFLQPRLTPTQTGRRIEAVYGQVEQAALLSLVPPEVAQMGINPAEMTIIPDIHKEVPTYDDDGMGITLKASRLLGTFDVGVVYQKGYASTPIIRDFDFLLDPSTQSARIELTQGYLPLQKVGLTAEGAWQDAGIWGEVAYNIPKEGFFSSKMDTEALPEEYRFNSDKHVTGLVGMDYFWENGVYINGQIIHGFPQEITKSMVNTYLTGDIYQDFLNNRLRLEGRLVYCFDDQGWMIMPEAVYQLDANKKCFGKLAFPGGDEQSLFRQMEDLTQVLVGISISF
ncbi:MAG: hypothetical protein GX998_04325 [Firmicutes bacterium]|nr:hypothetical protein [Bacillota bacterium]